MRKITLKATRYQEENGKVIACIGDCVFQDTKEVAGTRKGWSGKWEVTNLKGETKLFTTEKAIREWLGSQEIPAPAQELKLEKGVSFNLPKGSGKFIGESQGKKATKAQLKKWGVK
jgi:hypothetical protein